MMQPVKKQETPKPYWIERRPSGERVFCYKVRRHGKPLIQKLTLAEIESILRETH